MSKNMRNVLLLAKLETTEGTDASPTASADAMLAKTIGAQPVVAEFVDRDLMRPYFGNSGQLQVSNSSEIEFEIEFAGSGAAGTAPAYAPLLEACAFSETIVASTSVTYAPVTEDPKTCTIYYYLDGLLHKMTNCRGTVSMDINAKTIPVFKFKFVGVYVAPTDTASPVGADYSNFQLPQAVNKLNTPTLTLFGQSLCVDTCSIDMANDIKIRNLIGCDSVIMTDRKPAGNISLEMTDVATQAWHENVRQGTLGAFQLVHGVGAGRVIQIDAPKVQLTSPQYSNSDNIAMLSAGLAFQPDTGNDEITITLT